MIFFDPTGTRWKKFKTASGGMVALTVLPVAALISGALLLQPSWGAISIAQQTSHILSTLNSVAQSVVAPASRPIPTTKPATTKTHASSPKFSSSPAVPSATTTPVPSASATPSVSASPIVSPSPVATVTPGNSPYGQSHHPTK